jgi:hypothetical protein
LYAGSPDDLPGVVDAARVWLCHSGLLIDVKVPPAYMKAPPLEVPTICPASLMPYAHVLPEPGLLRLVKV